MTLPDITLSPKHYADYCLSLSQNLIDVLTSVFETISRPVYVLSIGSGTGLLEALLLKSWEETNKSGLSIGGVEVYSEPTVNKYLPNEVVKVVHGTWDILTEAISASALLFVYPRTTELVTKYLQLCSQSGCEVQVIVWLGPRADWTEYGPCFVGVPSYQDVEVFDDCGLVEYEMMAVIRRCEQQ